MKSVGFLIKFLLFINRIIIIFLEFVFEKISLHKGHLLRGILIGFVISIVVTILALLGHLKCQVSVGCNEWCDKYIIAKNLAKELFEEKKDALHLS